MLNKSLILGTLLVSTTFGAALPETGFDASLDLAGIQRMKGELSPLRVNLTSELRAHAIEEFTKAAAVLRSNPMMAESDPTTISSIGSILLTLDQKEAAMSIYKFELTLDKHVFGFSMAQTCFNLHKLGETELAIATLRGLINDASLNRTVREQAITYFYLINEDAHRAEAREMMASLLVETQEIATIEEARKAVSEKFPTNEEIAAKEKADEAEAGSDTSDMPPLEAA